MLASLITIFPTFACLFWFMLTILFVAFTVLLFILGNYAYRRTFAAREYKAEQRNADEAECRCDDIVDTDDAHPTLARRIVDVMDRQRLYLQPDLKITDLARTLGSNRTYVSHAIRTQLHTSFVDLVNGMRIDHAKRLLLASATLTKYEIALRSGYTCESSFYRKFTKYAGMTPAEWKQCSGQSA